MPAERPGRNRAEGTEAAARHDGPEGAKRRWNARYREKWGVSRPDRATGSDEPLVDEGEPGSLTRLLAGAGLPGHTPSPGLAVDLAGGDGAAGVALARRGFDAVIVDVSDVALAMAERRAVIAGVELVTIQLDLESMDLGQVLSTIDRRIGRPAPTLVTCMHYLNRGLLRSVPSQLPTGTAFAAAIATTTNLERHRRPSPRFLLDRGELEAILSPGHGGLRAVHAVEHWTPEGTNEAEVVVINRGVDSGTASASSP